MGTSQAALYDSDTQRVAQEQEAFLNTEGAKGIISVLFNFVFKFSWVSFSVGFTMILRLPKALGPYSVLPINKPRTFPSFIKLAIVP